MIYLDRDEREFWYWPVTGTDATPSMQVGEGVPAPMEAAPVDFEPQGSIPPEGTTWWRTLFAGPDATANPDGTVVITATERLRIHVTGNPEHLVEEAGWIALTS